MPEPMQRRLIMLFCFQADGCLETMDDETLGFAMHLSAPELQKTKELFAKRGFIEEGTWIPKNWEKRQRVSDDSGSRVSRYRERKSRVSNGTVTLQKLDGNERVSASRAPPRDRDRARIPEAEADTEAEAESPLPPLGESAAPLPDQIEPPEYPNEATSMFMVMPGKYPLDEIDAREIWGHIWRAWKDERLCFKFYEHQQWHKKDSWLHAIKTAIGRGVKPNSIKYLETIALEADDNGIKPDVPVQRAAIGNVPYVPTTKQDQSSKPNLDDYAAKEQANRKLAAEIEARKATNGRAR